MLEKAYGFPAPRAPSAPLDALVGTILSQNTSDTNSHRAYAAMRNAFPSWRDAMNAPIGKLEAALRPGGLAKVKSRRIQRILRSLDEHGDLSLGHLRNMRDEEVEQYLLSLDGVGYKTARCVLLFSLARDAFPIDTHVYRVLGRLGLIPPKMSPDKAHEHIPPLIPKGRCYPLHMNLIAHGRRTCHPRNPECPGCVLKRLCRYFAAERA